MNANTQRAIQTEQLHQQAKWGGRIHSVAEWLLILEKLTDDARRAWVTKDGDESALHEVRQIATAAIACLDQCGAPERAAVCAAPAQNDFTGNPLGWDLLP